MTAAIAVGVLVAAGVFLLSRRGGLPLVLGFILLGHAANFVLLGGAGLARREPPLMGLDVAAEEAADPLPQAFVLTAIVITFGITVFLLAILRRAEADALEGAEPDALEPGALEGAEPGEGSHDEDRSP